MNFPDTNIISAESTRGMISLLGNSAHYLFHWAFIIREAENSFRLLVASPKGEILADHRSKTFRGARITFARRFGKHIQIKGEKPEWSAFYRPMKYWLQHKLMLTELYNHMQRYCRRSIGKGLWRAGSGFKYIWG